MDKMFSASYKIAYNYCRCVQNEVRGKKVDMILLTKYSIK